MIKKLLAIVFTLIILIGLFVLYVFISTGFFREISDDKRFEEASQLKLVGAEDLTRLDDSTFLVSSDDRHAALKGEKKQGALYLVKRKNGKYHYVNLSHNYSKNFHPHGIDAYKLNDSTYRVLAINHTYDGNQFIEEFKLVSEKLEFVYAHNNPLIRDPNDVVIIDKRHFYFTNDHGSKTKFGKLLEDYIGLKRANVVHTNGYDYKMVDEGIAYANGINYDDERKLLYVASPRDFLLKVYSVQDNGDLSFIENIDCGTGVDNIELDKNGKLWIGCHPNLLRFASYMKFKHEITPSEIITIDYRSKGDYSLESIFENDGEIISGSTVAVPDGDHILVGSVADDHLSILTKTN